MAKKHLLILLLFITCLNARANFDFNANCIKAYDNILCLKLNAAQTLIQQEKQRNPNNAISILLDNYLDYFKIWASESRDDYENLKDRKSIRIAALEKHDKTSPYYLFTQAEVYLQWGLLKGKFGDFVSSAMDIKKAQSLLSENDRKFPGFLPNKKSLALINVLFGSVPSNIKGIAQFVGLKGNVAEGIKQLEYLRSAVLKTPYSFYKDELIYFYCYIDIDILHNKKNYSKLISFLDDMDKESLLKVFLQGYVSARTWHNEQAIAFLKDRSLSSQYTSLPAADYLLGNAKLNRSDSDANIYLIRYIQNYRGINFIKDSYLKLAYYYLLNNEPDKYSFYLKMVKSKGYAIDERDKQALKEANDPTPDKDILKARFYFDGGYYSKAFGVLKDKDVNEFKQERDKIEFLYRMGRIFEENQKSREALVYFQKSIFLGKSTPFYYSANAALRMGMIFEKMSDFNKAENFYRQAIAMKNHEYESSIENEAKVGLKRINR